MPDDAKGEKEIFRIENLEMVPLEPEKHGMFFGGDSYVIKYSYEKDGFPAYIIYFWQGNQSSQVYFKAFVKNNFTFAKNVNKCLFVKF